MNLDPAKRGAPFRRGLRRGAGPADAADSAPLPAAEPEDDIRAATPTDPGWLGSSYDLKHGLDVVELPTSLPADVLDRLFDALAK
jgi:hypothetical protein